MNRRIAAIVEVLPLALALAAAPLRAQLQQGSPIDDLLKRAGDAFNDLNYTRADSLARQVLAIGARITAAQRTRALLVIAAASYPEEVSAQRRAVALVTLKQIVRTNLALKLPQELTWAGLDSLVDEAKRTTFGLEVSGQTEQVVVGPQGTASLKVRGSRPGSYQLTIMPVSGGSAAIVDSLPTTTSGEFRFSAMRGERPVFTSGDWSVIVTGIDASRHDTVTVRYTARVDAPALEFVSIASKIDSSKLLPERTRRFGTKSIFPGLLVGGAAFALASTLRGEGNIKSKVGADSKGIAMGGVLALSTIAAGFADRGRSIPANIAANKAYGEAFRKSIVDLQAENRRRIAEYKTTLHIDLETR
jgi:hypothetical protein